VEADDLRALPGVLARVRRVFDLSADPEAIGRDLSADPLLRPLVAVRPGLRLPGSWVDAGAEAPNDRLPDEALAARAEVRRLNETRSWLRFGPWVDRLQLGWLPQAGSNGEVRARVDIALPFLEPLNPELRVLAIESERLRALRRGVEQDLEQKVRTATARLQSTVALVGVYEAATAAIDGSQDLVLRSLAADTVDVLRVATVPAKPRFAPTCRRGAGDHSQPAPAVSWTILTPRGFRGGRARAPGRPG
jgi:hypothetical protein